MRAPLFSVLIVGFALLVCLVPAPHASAGSDTLLITAVYYDPFGAGEDAEAVQIQNVSSVSQSLGGWSLTDGADAVTFPDGIELAPGAKVWAARSAAAFETEFGFLPAFEYGGDSSAAVPDMSGSAFALVNAGDRVRLLDAGGRIVDAVVYGDAAPEADEWSGRTIQPYDFGVSGVEGQILARKRQEANGLPTADTDGARDWAQDDADPYLGKRVLYPGWDADEFFQTVKTSDDAAYRFCVAPDHLYSCIHDEFVRATATISMEVYAFDNAALVDATLERLDAGVKVSLLVDGSALEDQGRWACAQIEAHGGQCWIMAGKPQSHVHKRYDSAHAKWIVIDAQRVLIGSENLGDDAMPTDDKADGTRGTRGGFVITDNLALVQAAQIILERDLAPAHHADIRRWGQAADDFPPLGFVPNYVNGGKGYRVQFPEPLVVQGAFPAELVQCPENCLRQSDALLGRVARAGAGDTLRVMQLYEYPYWGVGTSNSQRDPNLRLEAYLDAARRGARVRVLLDSFYDTFGEARSNYSACALLNSFQTRYDIECRLGNPTGRGIHIKLVVLEGHNTGWVHLGSINGSETSNKLNRELALQLESSGAAAYWARVFDSDWRSTGLAPHRLFIPLLAR